MPHSCLAPARQVLRSHTQKSAILKKPQISDIPTYIPILINNAIDILYRAVESRIVDANRIY